MAVEMYQRAMRSNGHRELYQFHRSMWTFHHKHYAEDMPAFANGVVWATIWARWAALSAAGRLKALPARRELQRKAK